jgi:hypothetical protein
VQAQEVLPGAEGKGGKGRCQLGMTPCSGVCVDTQSDPGHCNGCDLTCEPGQVCVAGSCTGRADDERICLGRCIPATHCCGNGDCIGEMRCFAGVCRCPDGLVQCGNACKGCCDDGDCGGTGVDLGRDPEHRGRCGRDCAGTVICKAGNCLGGAAYVFAGTWGRFGGDPGQFFAPRGVAVDGAGQVYVSDDENSRIQWFTPS